LGGNNSWTTHSICVKLLHKHDKLTQCCRAFTLALARLSCIIWQWNTLFYTSNENVLGTVDRIPGQVTCFIRHRPVTNRERPAIAETAHWPRDIARVVADRRLTNGVVQRHVDVIPVHYCDVNIRWTRDVRRLYVWVHKIQRSKCNISYNKKAPRDAQSDNTHMVWS